MEIINVRYNKRGFEFMVIIPFFLISMCAYTMDKEKVQKFDPKKKKKKRREYRKILPDV